jgi:hypothetical protein
VSISDPIKLDPPSELKKLGLSSIVIKGKNLFIEYNHKQIIYQYYKDDCIRIIKSIEKILGLQNIDPKVSTLLTVWLGEEYLKLSSIAEVSEKDSEENSILDKINELKSSMQNISREEWPQKIRERYQQLFDVTVKNMPDLWLPLEFALSVKTILNTKGCTLPFGGILLGVPGSSKTVVIELFRGLPHTFYSDSFTARSLVSNNSAIKKEKLKDVDMLPKIKDKFFLAPELAPIFSLEDKDLLQLLGILTRVLDGHGFESDSGTQGHRAYKGEYMFTMLGASVDIPYKVYKHVSALGPKLYFLRLPRVEHN